MDDSLIAQGLAAIDKKARKYRSLASRESCRERRDMHTHIAIGLELAVLEIKRQCKVML